MVMGILAACGADGSGSLPETTTTTTAVADSEFCATFDQLAAQRGGSDTARNADEAAWDRNIATVEHIAEVAPDEISAQADAYVEMVEARKALAEANGWADVTELPDDERSAFIAEHGDLQQQVNELIDYARANCEGMS
jgi:hypothetical protein